MYDNDNDMDINISCVKYDIGPATGFPDILSEPMNVNHDYDGVWAQIDTGAFVT